VTSPHLSTVVAERAGGDFASGIVGPGEAQSASTAVQFVRNLIGSGRSDAATGDQLLLGPVPLVPEIRLHLAQDAILFWARLEAAVRVALAAPYWVSAWGGGQALARYILDHPQVVRGRSVLDIGSGSGLAAIAAARAGARAVVANDIDPLAVAAISLNAEANAVELTPRLGDLLAGDGPDAEIVLVGDALYNDDIATAVLRYLSRVLDAGGRVLIGDPGRGHLPDGVELLATYRNPGIGTFGDAYIDQAHVFELVRRSAAPT
jgi:predicted nicotinamide N-methyase